MIGFLLTLSAVPVASPSIPLGVYSLKDVCARLGTEAAPVRPAAALADRWALVRISGEDPSRNLALLVDAFHLRSYRREGEKPLFLEPDPAWERREKSMRDALYAGISQALRRRYALARTLAARPTREESQVLAEYEQARKALDEAVESGADAALLADLREKAFAAEYEAGLNPMRRAMLAALGETLGGVPPLPAFGTEFAATSVDLRRLRPETKARIERNLPLAWRGQTPAIMFTGSIARLGYAVRANLGYIVSSPAANEVQDLGIYVDLGYGSGPTRSLIDVLTNGRPSEGYPGLGADARNWLAAQRKLDAEGRRSEAAKSVVTLGEGGVDALSQVAELWDAKTGRDLVMELAPRAESLRFVAKLPNPSTFSWADGLADQGDWIVRESHGAIVLENLCAFLDRPAKTPLRGLLALEKSPLGRPKEESAPTLGQAAAYASAIRDLEAPLWTGWPGRYRGFDLGSLNEGYLGQTVLDLLPENASRRLLVSPGDLPPSPPQNRPDLLAKLRRALVPRCPDLSAENNWNAFVKVMRIGGNRRDDSIRLVLGSTPVDVRWLTCGIDVTLALGATPR